MSRHLRLDLMSTPPEHPQAIMTRLGIGYQHATPQSILDQWWFWCCTNVPDPLPEFLEELHLEPKQAVGWGLSAADAERLDRIERP